MRHLIQDLISAIEYHVEQTRPIHSTTVALQAAREALKSLPAQQHGWKLVPLEPTQEMIDAVPTKPHPTRPNGWGDRNVAIYKAMIVASPQPAQQEPVLMFYEHEWQGKTSRAYQWLIDPFSLPEGTKLYTSPPAQKECEKCLRKND